MNGNPQQEARLVRNLLDAGCTQELIRQFMDKHNANSLSEQIRLLTEHRSTILHCVHEEQFKLECIDYLLFQLKKMRQPLTDVLSQPHNRRHIMNTIKQLGLTAAILGTLSAAPALAAPSPIVKPADADNFYQSSSVTTQPVTFKNQYRMDIAGNLYLPKNMDKNAKHPAIIVGHPMGAVKEQSANLYATKMAEQGFVTLSIDLAYWGGSGGELRNGVSPDMYAETFSAAVDFLGTNPLIDRERIGAIGICGSGSFAISAAKIDPRLKAIATISMYDMGSANRNALNKSQTLEQRKKIIAEAAAQRYVEFTGGETAYTSGTVHEITEKSHPIAREFYEFYRTPRGEFTPKGATSQTTTHPTLTSNVKFMNFYPFNDIETISPRALMFITGDQAHSKEFSEDAYKRAAEPKELVYVKGAGHVDLYDRVNLIPWATLDTFFKNNLK